MTSRIGSLMQRNIFSDGLQFFIPNSPKESYSVIYDTEHHVTNWSNKFAVYLNSIADRQVSLVS